ncbi:hypothetical protein Aduo_001357 [Ancylostoma duodenale]
MPQADMLNAEEQAVISVLNDAGESCKKIAETLEHSRHAVASYLNNPQTYGKEEFCGLLRKVNCQDEARICRTASNSTATFARSVQMCSFPSPVPPCGERSIEAVTFTMLY